MINIQKKDSLSLSGSKLSKGATHISWIKRSQAGQTLLIVVLVMVVALTVGLSVAVRSITNIHVSSEDENSQRAFSAAEAGIEKSLTQANNFQINGSLGNTDYVTKGRPLAGLGILVHNGTTVFKDEPVDVWLSDYSTDPTKIYLNQWTGNLTLNWGAVGEVPCSQAALEVVTISTTSPLSPKTNNKLATYTFDPCSSRSSAPNGNNFKNISSGSYTVNGATFAYQTTPISVTSGLLVRVIPLYASSTIGIGGNIPLPTQGIVIESTGVSENAQRKIVSFRGYPKLPIELFPFIMFSPK